LGTDNIIYLDNAATTAVAPEIAEAIKEIMVHNYGNPSSLHGLGLKAANHLRAARTTLASCLGTGEDEIIVTSGASEANNLALLGAALANQRKGRHIIYSAIEHPSVIEPMKFLSQKGFEVEVCPVNKHGIVEQPVLADMVRESTILVSIMMVNNEIGSVQNIAGLAKAARTVNQKVYFHSDCVQAFGKVMVKPRQLGIDMLSLSAHKLHGPKGVGALYLNKGIKWNSLSLGGGQEGGRRSGTENVPGAVGFALAAENACKNLEPDCRHMYSLKEHLLRLLGEQDIPFAVNGPDPLDSLYSAPHILNISFPGIRGEVLMHFLERDHIYISTGSACSSQKTKSSHVLKALNLPGERADGAVRISLSPCNNRQEIVRLVESLSRAVSQIRDLV
jgi:cysteine desulfurase